MIAVDFRPRSCAMSCASSRWVVVGEHIHDNMGFDPAAVSSRSGLDDVAQVDRLLSQLQARTRHEIAAAELSRFSGARLPDLRTATVDLIATELKADFADVFELQPSSDAFRLVASAGWCHPAPGTIAHVQPDGPIATGALRTNAPFIVHDWRQETRFRPPTIVQAEGNLARG